MPPAVHHNAHYDIIVLGLGANGSSALYHLSKTGKRVLGIDRFHPPHRMGSSHGESRIIRQAYFEHPLYVPLIRAAYPLWEELEAVSGKTLLRKTGGLMLGREDAAVVKGALLSAELHDIPHEYLDAGAIRRRFPAFRAPADTVGVLETEAGILLPEECIRAFLSSAVRNGAIQQTDEQVLEIQPGKDGVTVLTTKGRYMTDKLIVSAGAWTGGLLPDLRLPLTVKRQVLFWFDNANQQTRAWFRPDQMPVFIWEYEPAKMFYGIPDLGSGLKLAPHHRGRQIDADSLRQDTSDDEIAEMRSIAADWLAMDPVYRDNTVCMYTNTPDENFIIDFHPAYPNIIVASPCSGHGFKFSSLTGQLLCQLAVDGHTRFDLSPFRIGRFL
ncbi:MAG TPA: N-methyl-L-tryptophan oxidase [Puia sp.]|nr:N-methyl-L-tryptophan oxidase [Puia sp.]